MSYSNNPLKLNTPTTFFSNQAYDFAKFIAQIGLPAAGALYFGLASIWGLPNAEEIVGTITVVDAFLGVMLGISTSSYNRSEAKYDGIINIVQPEEGQAKILIEKMLTDENNLGQKSEIIFKVNP